MQKSVFLSRTIPILKFLAALSACFLVSACGVSSGGLRYRASVINVSRADGSYPKRYDMVAFNVKDDGLMLAHYYPYGAPSEDGNEYMPETVVEVTPSGTIRSPIPLPANSKTFRQMAFISPTNLSDDGAWVGDVTDCEISAYGVSYSSTEESQIVRAGIFLSEDRSIRAIYLNKDGDLLGEDDTGSVVRFKDGSIARLPAQSPECPRGYHHNDILLDNRNIVADEICPTPTGESGISMWLGNSYGPVTPFSALVGDAIPRQSYANSPNGRYFLLHTLSEDFSTDEDQVLFDIAERKTYRFKGVNLWAVSNNGLSLGYLGKESIVEGIPAVASPGEEPVAFKSLLVDSSNVEPLSIDAISRNGLIVGWARVSGEDKLVYFLPQ